MTRLIFLLTALLLLVGCGTWQTKTRTAMRISFETIKTADGIGAQIMHQKCMDIAKECGKTSPGVCPKLTECQATKHRLESIAITAYRAICAVLLGVELGEEKATEGRIRLVMDIVKQARDALVAAGVL